MSDPKTVVTLGAVMVSFASYLQAFQTIFALFASILSAVWVATRLFEIYFPRHYRLFVSKFERPGKYIDGTKVPNTRGGNDAES